MYDLPKKKKKILVSERKKRKQQHWLAPNFLKILVFNPIIHVRGCNQNFPDWVTTKYEGISKGFRTEL
jgi:hypothetical protein